MGMRDGQHQGRGDGCVHRAASLAQHVHADPRRDLVLRDHHASAGAYGLRRGVNENTGQSQK